jgi:hypothetical protein
MSTDYVSLDTIYASDLFDGRLEKFGIKENIHAETNEHSRSLADGNNFLWCHIDDDGKVDYFTRYMPNGNPSRILAAIAETFDTDIVSEYDHRFWGYETEEEWDEAQRKSAQQDDERWHGELMKFLAGEPADILPGSIGMIKANYARVLVDADPALLHDRERLRVAVEDKYENGDHTARVELTQRQIEAVKMRMTHEDDLPRA